MIVSIVIRTLNEERYLNELLSSINQQKRKDFEIEVVLIDSGSNDNTLNIAKDFNCNITFIKKSDFTFGRSLNMGSEFSNGDILVYISGHCIPVENDWLLNLVQPIIDKHAQYTYGKQVGRDTTKFSENQLFKKFYPEDSKIPQNDFFCNNANSAITSNITKLTIRRDLKPILNAYAQYELCFGNEFHVDPRGKNIKSTGFKVEGNNDTLYFSDIPNEDLKTGNLAVVQLSDIEQSLTTVVVPNAGTVDYVKGEIIVNTIKITESSLASGLIEIQVYPESNDIIGLKDLYLQLDMSNTKINIVRDTISSGQQISGIGYKVTSSYSNGTITRQK